MTSSPRIYHGSVINPQTTLLFDALPNCLIFVNSSGTIDWIENNVPGPLLQSVMAAHGVIDTDAEVIDLKRGEFIMPGFIDTHTHAPQVPNIGTGQQYELLEWLDKVTFPTEAKFSDPAFAKNTYRSVVRRFIDCGTTTCSYYGSLHLEATRILANVVHSFGQRALIGKCNMDRNCPSYYVEDSAETSLSQTRALISHIDSLNSPLVRAILTPRFAISCTPVVLESLGHLAAEKLDLPIQTHISENLSEVAYTKELFPDRPSYADVYDHYGLLRSNTILAHGVHLTSDEIDLVRRRGAGISHCPTSNFNLRSGMAPVGIWLDRGIKVGLGTDVSGGFSPCLLTAIQHASICSKMVAVIHQAQTADPPAASTTTTSKFANQQLPISTLLHMATLGGAEVASVGSTVGSFAPGKSFDALLVSLRPDLPPGDLNPAIWSDEQTFPASGVSEIEVVEELKEMLARFFFCGDDRNIREVYVQGKMIGGRNFRK